MLLSLWKEEYVRINVRISSRVLLCCNFDQMFSTLYDCPQSRFDTKEILLQKRLHIEMVACKRHAYQPHEKNAGFNPFSACSIVVDGADQSAFGLPFFTVPTKDLRVYSMKVGQAVYLNISR